MESWPKLDHAAQAHRGLHRLQLKEATSVQLYDPTSSSTEQNLSRAAALASLEGKTIGILENGKLNAVEMLQEVADLFVTRHNCIVHTIIPSRTPAPLRRQKPWPRPRRRWTS
jgi:hypothetical protein